MGAICSVQRGGSGLFEGVALDGGVCVRDDVTVRLGVAVGDRREDAVAVKVGVGVTTAVPAWVVVGDKDGDADVKGDGDGERDRGPVEVAVRVGGSVASALQVGVQDEVGVKVTDGAWVCDTVWVGEEVGDGIRVAVGEQGVDGDADDDGDEDCDEMEDAVRLALGDGDPKEVVDGLGVGVGDTRGVGVGVQLDVDGPVEVPGVVSEAVGVELLEGEGKSDGVVVLEAEDEGDEVRVVAGDRVVGKNGDGAREVRTDGVSVGVVVDRDPRKDGLAVSEAVEAEV